MPSSCQTRNLKRKSPKSRQQRCFVLELLKQVRSEVVPKCSHVKDLQKGSRLLYLTKHFVKTKRLKTPKDSKGSVEVIGV